MKTNRLFLIVFLFIGVQAIAFGQDNPKFQYSIGAGGTHDGNNMLYGVNFTNELNYRLGKRTSLNLGLMFYQSLGSFRDYKFAPGQRNIDNSSGFFITPALKYANALITIDKTHYFRSFFRVEVVDVCQITFSS